MKYLLLVFSCMLISFCGYSQVGVGTTTPDTHSVLDVTSTTKGLLPPRLSAAQRTTLGATLNATQTGMQVADATTGQLYYWNGSAWKTTVYTSTSPVSINATTNVVALNPGTTAGDLITWDGNNWVNSQPAVQHFSIPFDNRQPYLAVNFSIALNGVFPSQNGTDPYIGEIDMFGFTFAPNGWALCNGQLLPISQNTALFSLLGTIYGGNGQTTFALPDLRGRVPINKGQGPGLSNYNQGESSGAEQVTITH